MSFEELKIFHLAYLTKICRWEEIQSVMDEIIAKLFIDFKQDTVIFDGYSLISKYITPQNVTEWNTGNIST